MFLAIFGLFPTSLTNSWLRCSNRTSKRITQKKSDMLTDGEELSSSLLEGLYGKTLAQPCCTEVEVDNKWITLIHNTKNL